MVEEVARRLNLMFLRNQPVGWVSRTCVVWLLQCNGAMPHADRKLSKARD